MAQSKLTKAARGQECTIQIHPYCNMNPETTVFAHAPSESKGMGIKSPDWWGADSCSVCHDIVDARITVNNVSISEIYRCHMRGVFRTMQRRIEQGLIKI
jgi:hypothetical protein